VTAVARAFPSVRGDFHHTWRPHMGMKGFFLENASFGSHGYCPLRSNRGHVCTFEKPTIDFLRSESIVATPPISVCGSLPPLSPIYPLKHLSQENTVPLGRWGAAAWQHPDSNVFCRILNRD
jgi:hypothetical protein